MLFIFKQTYNLNISLYICPFFYLSQSLIISHSRLFILPLFLVFVLYHALSVCLYVCLSFYMSVCMSVFLSISLYTHTLALSLIRSISQYECPSVFLSISLYVCLSFYLCHSLVTSHSRSFIPSLTLFDRSHLCRSV